MGENQGSIRCKQPVPMPKKIQARKSAIHGNGVFAVAPIKQGERVIQYKGCCAATATLMPMTAATSKAAIPSCSPSTMTG